MFPTVSKTICIIWATLKLLSANIFNPTRLEFSSLTQSEELPFPASIIEWDLFHLQPRLGGLYFNPPGFLFEATATPRFEDFMDSYAHIIGIDFFTSHILHHFELLEIHLSK